MNTSKGSFRPVAQLGPWCGTRTFREAMTSYHCHLHQTMSRPMKQSYDPASAHMASSGLIRSPTLTDGSGRDLAMAGAQRKKLMYVCSCSDVRLCGGFSGAIALVQGYVLASEYGVGVVKSVSGKCLW